MKFLIVDDHPLFREALRDILHRVNEGAQCLEAADCESSLDLIDAHPDIDLMLLDVVIPCAFGRGIEFLEELAASRPQLPVVMLSASEDPKDMRQALDIGALGYIPKSLPTKVMISALELVLAGGIYIPPHLIWRGAEAAPPRPAPMPAASPLTPRQMEIARLLGSGKSNKEIGRLLGLSPYTIKAHLAAIFRALGVSNRTQAVAELGRRLKNMPAHDGDS